MTKVMCFAAHEDDDTAWMLPDIQHAITAGNSVRVVFVTDGGTSIMASRETGVLAGYSQMAGVANAWTATDAGISGHSAPLQTLNAAPQISVVFMRIVAGDPTGGAYIQNLLSGQAPTAGYNNGAGTYTLAQLRSALQYLIAAFTPDYVYTQDFAGNIGDGDHSDHHCESYLARDAAIAWQATTPTTPLVIRAYEGYGTAVLPVNVSGADLTAKNATLAAETSASGGNNTPPGYCSTIQYVTSQLTLPATGPWLVQQGNGQYTPQAGALTGTATTTGSPAYKTSAPSEYLVSFYADTGGTVTVTKPAGWTADTLNVSTSNAHLAVAYKSSTGGSETGSWGLTGSPVWTVLTTAFRLSGTYSVLQSASASGTLESSPATFGTNLTSGSVLLAFVQFQTYIGQYTVSVADGSAHQFTKIAEVQSPGSGTYGVVASIWALATPSGDVGTKPVITATSSSSGSFRGALLVQEVSGVTAVPDAAAQSVVLPLPAASVAGNSLILTGRTVAQSGASAAILPTAVTDSGGNSWALSTTPASSPPAIAFPGYSAAFEAWALATGSSATSVTVTLPAYTAYAELAVTEWKNVASVSAAGTVDNHTAAAEIVAPSLTAPASSAVVGLAYPSAGAVMPFPFAASGMIGGLTTGQPCPVASAASSAPPTAGVLPLGGIGYDAKSSTGVVNWAAWQVTGSSSGALAWDWGAAAASIQVAAVFTGAPASYDSGTNYGSTQATSGGTGTWVNPGYADGAPNAQFATWVVP